MNRLPSRAGRLALALAAASTALRLAAQTAPVPTAAPDETVHMSPFLVQQGNQSGYLADQTLLGTRSTSNLADISGTVSIIDHDMIDDLAATSYAQLIDFGVAGVTQFQNFQDDMMIRGFRSQSMRDGVINPGTEVALPMYDVDRVEVIKGPAAMLLGTNAFLGGAVNYVPLEPTATPQGRIDVTGQLDGKGNGYGRFSVNTMGPIHRSDNLSVNYRFTVGGMDGGTDKKNEKLQDGFFGGAISATFNRNTTLDVNFYLYKNNTYIYYDDFLDYNAYSAQHRLEISPLSRTFAAAPAGEGFEREGDATLDAKLLTQLTEADSLQLHYVYFDTGLDSALARTVTYVTPTTLSRQYIPDIDNGTNGVFQADFLDHRDFDVLVNDAYAGIDYTTSYSRSASNVYTLPTISILAPDFSGDAAVVGPAKAGGWIGPNGGDDRFYTDLTSYYVQDNVSFLKDRVNLIGGLRWFHEHQTHEDANFQFDGGNYSTATDFAPLRVYKVGAVVKPLPWLSLYWSKMTNETPQTRIINTITGPGVLGNQVGNDTEFGAKVNYKVNDWLTVYGDIDHFNMALTNVFTTDSSGQLAPNGNIVTGGADNTSVGLEYELGLQIRTGPGRFDIFGTGYHADTKAAAINAPELAASGTPNKVYSLLLKYTWLDGALKGLVLGGGGYGQGPRYELALPIHTPTIFDAFARYEFARHWSVQANFNNLTNKIYIVRAALPGLIQASMPMDYSATVRYKW